MPDPYWVAEASYADFMTGAVVGSLATFLLLWATWGLSLTYRLLRTPERRKGDK